ncbi:aminotransferase [Chthonobacter albigriseus]|uniref:aminotransferase n=1 Tax=Chthonobacter albigriseus TaxID=1683161 RepID=UPI0015EF2C48|nr:aminotransferase [Chthonobacter albigriseus]
MAGDSALRVNPLLVATDVPPIPAAQAWARAYDGRLGKLINLAQAVPGDPPPDVLLERLGAEARTASAATYGSIYGDLALREALARDVNAVYGGDVIAAEIAITAGCNQAFFVTAMALAQAGDEIILPAPWYFNHKMTLDMLGIVAKPLLARPENGFVPAVEDARALISAKTRAILLVTPNNPTGATYPAAVIAAFAALAEEAGIALVLDETYRDFMPAGAGAPHALFAAEHWRDRVIQLYSFSKAYAIPGHRLGSIIAGTVLMEEIGKVLDCVQICPPRAAQAAIAWAIPETAAWRAQTRDTIVRRADVFRAVVAGAPGWSIAAIGAYFAYVAHPFEATGEAVGERLAREAGVLALPGSFFGPGQEKHLRFAFANVDEASLRLVTERLRALV